MKHLATVPTNLRLALRAGQEAAAFGSGRLVWVVWGRIVEVENILTIGLDTKHEVVPIPRHPLIILKFYIGNCK